MAEEIYGNRSRSIEEVRKIMLERAARHRNPFMYTVFEEVEMAMSTLSSLDSEAWAETFSKLAKPYEEAALVAQETGNQKSAMDWYLAAYNYYHLAWYPAPSSASKLFAYKRSVENYLKAARHFDPPLSRIEIPFRSRPGEGQYCVAYLRRPKNAERPPVVVIWGGIDAYKEERNVEFYLSAGLATLAIDIPGTGEAPLPGSEDAERLWDDVFDWISNQADLNADRIGIVGGSTGGYWATKVAHTHRDRIRAAVNHGGMVHYGFTPEWIAQAQFGEYPFELAESLALAFGLSTYDDWVKHSPKFSLLRQGILDQPCAPLLLINGLKDTVFPISDMYLLLEHGNPKCARFFDTGHMGRTPATEPTIVDWIQKTLA